MSTYHGFLRRVKYSNCYTRVRRYFVKFISFFLCPSLLFFLFFSLISSALYFCAFFPVHQDLGDTDSILPFFPFLPSVYHIKLYSSLSLPASLSVCLQINLCTPFFHTILHLSFTFFVPFSLSFSLSLFLLSFFTVLVHYLPSFQYFSSSIYL